ncbi:thermonuclease family protein [Maricaulis maris]|uniref:Endonuclease YncB(Thermonuclease family) n=1 Tax=Maricaulis maris TaxID=74318 RepID=A0A495CVS7_9PROT|nr:thermonuclease family protein [Maricaulis maris]RKQ89495.1 endonuclease YncB(thermonuclease family) [Maricaulis maris]
MRGLALSVLCLAACGPSAAVQDANLATVGVESVLIRPQGEAGEHGAFIDMAGALTVRIETPDGPLEVRLAEIDTPVPTAAQAWLADRLAGREVSLVYSGARRDRYDRALAQLVLADVAVPDGAASANVDVPEGGDWLQYRLVEAGLARVMTHADNQAHATPLLAAEAAARAADRGLWADPDHRIRDTHPDARAQDVGTAQIIEGRVLDAVQLNSGRIYLNFGRDYRSDFTIRIDAGDAGAFEAAGLTPERLEGQRVRVRGWLIDENGPMIQLDHPARLELIGEDGEAAMAR